MPITRCLVLVTTMLAVIASAATGDDVLLKNKTLYRGAVDKDNTLRQISDGLKRIIIRDSKIEKITPNDSLRGLERFQIVQPLEVHAGAMPTVAIGVQATPWNDKGRRQFSYYGPRSKSPVVMTQAINDLGPYMVRFRGVDGFWVGQVTTKQVPKPVVIGLLGRVDQTVLNERQRIARFLLQSEWYPEAKAQVESIAKDFPEERERAKEQVKAIQDLQARQELIEISVIRGSRRPKDLIARLHAFPSENVSSDVIADAREQLRKEEEQVAADRRLGESLRDVEKALTPDLQKGYSRSIAEILRDLEQAPDAVRSRLDPFAKADPKLPPESRLALALSGWIVGPEAASSSPEEAAILWKARTLVRDYLRASDDASRSENLASIQSLAWTQDKARPDGKIDLETLSRLIPLMPPPLHSEPVVGGKEVTHRVANDVNDEPTEYMVLLPPEYHPMRNYPTIVALHDGRGPKSAIDWWREEAARRGYIIIAPEYLLPGQAREYRFSASEHAAVELSLRDARKRYAIDSDRVYLGGQVVGGIMALDFGLAHPDLFAGVASVSGLPAKYVFTYRKHVEHLPLYLAIGDLAPSVKEAVFDGFARPMIADTLDVTYVEYYRRGLEDLPEEASAIVDWMDKRRRGPTPKSFEVFSARPSDARFFGVVIQDLAPGSAIAPEAADPLGKNIKPAKITMRSSAPSNLLNITTTGIVNLDVWVSPKLIDFKRRMEVRINGRPFFKGLAKLDPAALLTDLRFRGDRQQLYWMKVTTAR